MFYTLIVQLKRTAIEAYRKAIIMEDYFGTIIGYEDIKDQLRMIADMLRNPEEYEKFGVTINDGLLLTGRPGLGKTTMADCLIKASGRKAFICRKKASDGDFLKTIDDIVQEAYAEAPSIIFFDDIDKFSDSNESVLDTEEFAAVQAGIDELKGEDVFIMATANHPEKLPESLTRHGRLGTEIHFRCPTLEEGVAIVKHYLNNAGIDGMDAESIARMLNHESCATLENVVKTAGMKAAYKRRDKVAMEDMVDACLDEVLGSPASSARPDPEAMERIACHEAGHALAAELLQPKTVAVISIRPGMSTTSGAVHYCRDKKEKTMLDAENEMKISLAGKAAVEVMYGVADFGANADLHHAFDAATNIVDNCCAYGFDAWIEDDNANVASDNRNREMAYLVRKEYVEVKKLLIENRTLLEKIMNILLEKTTITYSEFQEIMHAEAGA